MSEDMSTTEKSIRPKIMLVALFFSFFVSQTPAILSGLLLIDISQTFNISIGIAAQMRTFATGLGVIIALLMGAISVKYKHKTLLQIGLILIAVSAIGCSYSPNLAIMFIVYSIGGLGVAMVSPMGNSLVGEHFKGDMRPLAIGMLIASGSLSYVIGAPIISQLERRIGWRLTFLSYILILNIIAIILVQISVPSQQKSLSQTVTLLSGFKSVLQNRSALACIFGAVISSASWQGFVYFSTSFYRSSFEMPTILAAYLISVLAIFFTFGSVLSGRITNRFGRKRLTTIGVALMGLFTIVFTNVSWFWFSFSIAILGCFCGGIRYAASNNLSLEQVPEFRGTMMSLNSAAISLGSTFGSMVGGYVLLVSNWSILGALLGVFGIIASLIYKLFSKDPIITPS